ncbi:MAG TPA: hemerythrin domain-containing protein [Streptosporangiaceae bacterium]|nr:hemerythrin domain-containing protein [Streptosporangiaceae bacterium]
MTVANIDMTRMYLMHDALRRELNRMARATARAHDDPKAIMSTALGWVLFKRFLHIHHTAEDVALWPVMRQALSGRPDELALLDAMEAEHATIQPLLDAIDATVADRNSRPDVLGGLTDALAGVLRGHLKHEEDEALAVIEATITPGQWQAFVDQHNQLGADDMPRMLAWVLEDASAYGIEAMLSSAPPAARLKYRNEWQPAYAALDLWRERNTP